MCRKLFLLTSFLLVLALVSTNVTLADVIRIPIMDRNDDGEDHIAYDGETDDGAESRGSSDLEMPWESDTGASSYQVIGLRFVSVAIPKGAIINSAYVQFTADNNDDEKLVGGPVNLIINGLLQSNPEGLGGNENFSEREPKTAAEVNWTDIPEWSKGTATDESKTPDIASVIQEIINQSDWAEGNALMLLIRDDETSPSAANRSALSFIEYAPEVAPVLHIEFGAAPAAPALPEGWQSRDIGTTGGSAAESGGTWAISADGDDVWWRSDQFHYAYVPLSGDGTIIARVVSNGEGSDSWAKGGVMIRESLNWGSKHAIMALTGGEGGGMAFQNRQESGGISFSSHGDPTAAPPYWVKLTRVGNTITGYSSADGFEWVQQPDGTGGDMTTNPVDIEMAEDVYIGLFVTSHASGEIRTYTFDNVRVVKLVDVTAPWDLVQGVPNDGDWPHTYRPETPDMAIDDNIETKYLHFKGDFDPDPGTGGAGFRVTPWVGPTIVTGLTLTTANDFPGRDPIAFELSGSNESIDGPYELIARDYIVDFIQADAWPRLTKNATPISFKNGKAYTHYQLIFTAIRGPVGGGVNSMQIAEVELLRELYVDADITAIEEFMDLYALAMTTGDLDLWISLYTDDTVKMLPDAPATFGKEELRASMKPLFDNYTFEEMVISDLVIQVAGDWAFTRCNFTVTMTPKAGGEPLYIDAKDLCILERQADGSWKIYWDCWNSNVSPPQ